MPCICSHVGSCCCRAVSCRNMLSASGSALHFKQQPPASAAMLCSHVRTSTTSSLSVAKRTGQLCSAACGSSNIYTAIHQQVPVSQEKVRNVLTMFTAPASGNTCIICKHRKPFASSTVLLLSICTASSTMRTYVGHLLTAA